ncbi:MAG TPA: universal stress protein [Longimicrobium sp.]|nr:universal stress protein [Longimicrobium sp.]
MTEAGEARSEAFRSVLVATDLSEGSDLLVHTAAAIAERSGAALHLVHAVEDAAGEEQARRAVGEQARRAAPAAEVHVSHSAPERAISERAEAVRADLIVVGPHVRATGSGFLGSTAERVLASAGAPCLVVRVPLVPAVRHVVAAVDPGHRMDAALESAVAWALLFGGEAGVPHVTALYVTGDRSEAPPELERALGLAMTRCQAQDRVNASVALRGTDVVESIVLYVEVEASDLLVMSTRNRGMLGRALLGSVSAEVTRRAPCNVLLVPPRD